MKTIKLLSLFLFTALAVSSCDTISVASDYDDKADFSQYKTYAFFKEGIDKAEISDLDKKRILGALDTELAKKGYTKSEKPDILINFFTQANKNVNVNNWGYGYGWGGGWGWGPYWGGPYWGGSYASVSTTTEGTLYIDILDANKKELIWQGVGNGVLTLDRDKKQARINEFVTQILTQYPPQKNKK